MVSMDLHLDNTISDVQPIKEQQVVESDCSILGKMIVHNGAHKVLDKMSESILDELDVYDMNIGANKDQLDTNEGQMNVKYIKATLLEDQVIDLSAQDVDLINLFLFDPGGDINYAYGLSEGKFCPLVGKAYGTCVSGMKAFVWGEIVMEGDAYKVFDEMPESNSRSKGFSDGVEYGKYTENVDATQGSNCDKSQFSLTPNEHIIKTLDPHSDWEIKNAQNKKKSFIHDAKRVEYSEEEKLKDMEIIPLMASKVNSSTTLYDHFTFIYVQHNQNSCHKESELRLAKLCPCKGISQANEYHTDEVLFLFDPGGTRSLRVWCVKGYCIMHYGILDDNSWKNFTINVASSTEFFTWLFGWSRLVIFEYEIDKVVLCSNKTNGCYSWVDYLSGSLRWISPSSFYVILVMLASVVWDQLFDATCALDNYISSYDTSALKAINGFLMKKTYTGRFDRFDVFLNMLEDCSNFALLIPIYVTQNGLVGCAASAALGSNPWRFAKFNINIKVAPLLKQIGFRVTGKRLRSNRSTSM